MLEFSITYYKDTVADWGWGPAFGKIKGGLRLNNNKLYYIGERKDKDVVVAVIDSRYNVLKYMLNYNMNSKPVFNIWEG